MQRAWGRGDYDDVFTEESRAKQSTSSKASWQRGDHASRIGCELSSEHRQRLSVAVKEAWARGDFAERTTDEFRRKISRAVKTRWVRGDFDGTFANPSKETRCKQSKAMKALWASGVMGNEEWHRKQSQVTKKAWEQGVYDSVFRSPTSIELEVAAALDILGIKHESQYRPEDYSCIFDEFIPPNTLIEVQGDYWHGDKRPDNQRHDAEKAQWAKENGYELIEIWEHEIRCDGAWSMVMHKLPLDL